MKMDKIKSETQVESNYTIPLDHINLMLPSRNENPALIFVSENDREGGFDNLTLVSL